MPIRQTRVFGERQYIKRIQGVIHRVQVVKVFLDLEFLETRFKLTVKLTRRENLSTGFIKTTATVTSNF